MPTKIHPPCYNAKSQKGCSHFTHIAHQTISPLVNKSTYYPWSIINPSIIFATIPVRDFKDAKNRWPVWLHTEKIHACMRGISSLHTARELNQGPSFWSNSTNNCMLNNYNSHWVKKVVEGEVISVEQVFWEGIVILTLLSSFSSPSLGFAIDIM